MQRVGQDVGRANQIANALAFQASWRFVAT